jgi:beta-glucosidase
MPFFYNHKLKSAGTPVQSEFGALFPFGHGLSYAEFEYRDFSLAEKQVPVDGRIVVSGIVENTSRRDGDEIVQLYVRDVHASLVRPVIELKGFQRLRLGAGQRAKVTFSLPADMLGFTVAGNERAIEPGDIEVMIGKSSRDIVFTSTATLTGGIRYLQEDWAMVCRTNVEYVE